MGTSIGDINSSIVSKFQKFTSLKITKNSNFCRSVELKRKDQITQSAKMPKTRGKMIWSFHKKFNMKSFKTSSHTKTFLLNLSCDWYF